MTERAYDIAVIGAGAWGTALAMHCQRLGHRTLLWAHEPATAEHINQHRENQLFLPGHRLPDGDFARIWEDSCRLLARGVELGAIVTVDGAGPADGRYRERTNIFGKSECPRCEGKVRRMVIAGRKAYACPSCQPRRRPAARKVRAGA